MNEKNNLGSAVEEAYISNDRNYTIFRTGKITIRFLAPYSLEKYTSVKEWDNGYLVVMAKYAHNENDEEEYIDMKPILRNLYFEADEFLKPIRKVSVKYD